MATKKTTTGAKKTTAAKKPAPKKAAPKKAAKKATPAPKEPEKPAYLKLKIEEFVVGTEHYRNMVQDHNDKFGTTYNTWRVRPQILYTIFQRMHEHYK